MQLDAWTTKRAGDSARRKRLTIGYAVGGVVVAVALTGITFGAHGKMLAEEEAIEVSLAALPETEAAPEPEPPPKVVKRKKRRSKKLAVGTPKDVPDGVPDEADPNGNPYDEDDFEGAFGEEGGDGDGTIVKKVAKRPKAEPKTEVAPVAFSLETGRSEPARPLSQPRPAYPAEARSQGIQGIVILRFMVTATGGVTHLKIIKGHPALNRAVLSAVQSWTFKPALHNGTPVTSWRTARFPFRISS